MKRLEKTIKTEQDLKDCDAMLIGVYDKKIGLKMYEYGQLRYIVKEGIVINVGVVPEERYRR